MTRAAPCPPVAAERPSVRLELTYAVARTALVHALGEPASRRPQSVDIVFRIDDAESREPTLRVIARHDRRETELFRTDRNVRVRALADGWHAECPRVLTALFDTEGRARYANPAVFATLAIPGGRYELTQA